MTWTSQKPTQAGWYWFKQDLMKEDDQSEPFILYINHLGEACESGSTTRHIVDTLCGEWSSTPLEPPK